MLEGVQGCSRAIYRDGSGLLVYTAQPTFSPDSTHIRLSHFFPNVLSVAEVLEVFRKEQQIDSERRLFRRITIALAVALVMLVASLTGMTYGIVWSGSIPGFLAMLLSGVAALLQ